MSVSQNDHIPGILYHLPYLRTRGVVSSPGLYFISSSKITDTRSRDRCKGVCLVSLASFTPRKIADRPIAWGIYQQR